MNETMLETIRETFARNERLFRKLHMVGNQYDNIDFDESGLYQDDEQIVNGRWEKLSTKVCAALNDALADTAEVSIVDRSNPGYYELILKVVSAEEDPVKLCINYADEEQITFTQNG